MEAPRQANDSGEHQPSGSSPECNAGSASKKLGNDSEARHEVEAAAPPTLTSPTNPHPDAGQSDEPLPASTSTDQSRPRRQGEGGYGGETPESGERPATGGPEQASGKRGAPAAGGFEFAITSLFEDGVFGPQWRAVPRRPAGYVKIVTDREANALRSVEVRGL